LSAALLAATSAAALADDPPLCSGCQGLGLSASFLDANAPPELLLGWAESGEAPALRYQVRANLSADGTAEATGPAQTAGNATGAVVDVGLAAGRLENGTRVLVYAWAEESGVLRYRLGQNLDEKGAARWGEALSVPEQASIAGISGVGAALCDVDRNGQPDLVLAWTADGQGRYRIGYDHSTTAAARWSLALEVGGGEIHAGRGAGVACTNLDEDYAPELVFAWSGAGDAATLAYRTGRNLSSGGAAASWSEDQGEQALAGGSVQGSDLAAVRLGGSTKADLLYGWVTAEREQLAVVADPELVPPYEPTEEDLKAVGDEPTGFSVAAVKAQKAAGIYSPGMLVEHMDGFAKKAQSEAQLLEAINQGLEALRVPTAVKPELEQFLLQYYGVKGGAGL
jgi:hypothetical protein